MKVIIAGSRHLAHLDLVIDAVSKCFFDITEVVCGGAPGIDTLGKYWAFQNNIPVKYFHAEWHKYGKAAGPIRNEEMAQYADALIAIWDGKSKGTKNMIDLANEYKLRTYIAIVGEEQ
jgi:hypothetical protein